MADVLKYIPPYIREQLLLIRGRIKSNSNDIKNEITKLAESDDKSFYASEADVQYWKKALIRLSMVTNKRGLELAKEFYSDPIKIVKENYLSDKQDLVLICPAKNELDNLKLIYEHYKKLGVKSFAFIDNMSDDGTAEYFSSFNDVNVYLASEKYTSLRRQVWINRVMAHYGFDKWYLVIDSDEFLDYNDSENKSIYDVIEHCKKNNIKRAKALMLDMYPKSIVFNGEKTDFLNTYKYFDKSGYTKIVGKDALLIDGLQGGVRVRIFTQNDDDKKPWLTKFPLIYIQRGDIQYQSHMSYPFYKNFKSDNIMVLRHYKFLPTDLEKYRQRVKDGNFSAGSKEYVQYVSMMEKGSIDFWNESVSATADSDSSYYCIKELKPIDW